MVSGSSFSRNRKSRIFFYSDAHRDAPYADSAEADQILEDGLQGYWRLDSNGKKEWVEHPATCCVGGGDNYEGVNLPIKGQPETIFKYSRHIDSHIEHLRSMILSHPGCKFIKVKGNHGRLPEFDIALDQLAAELGPDNLEIQSHIKKIGDALFLHGDQAINPKKYHVDWDNPQDYSNFDGRYKESYAELYRAPFLQALHDVGNRYLPWTIGRLVLRTARCARDILDWAHEIEVKRPEHAGLLQKVNHFFSGHTHDPYTDFKKVDKRVIDPETGKPKVFHFHNAGGSIFQIGRINRHCFNAMSVFLDSENIESVNAKVTEIISYKWPQFRWSSEHDEEKRTYVSVAVQPKPALDGVMSVRIGYLDPGARPSITTTVLRAESSETSRKPEKVVSR